MDATQDTNNISIEEALEGLVSELPRAVREFVLGPKKDQVALELTQKYQLHADQAGEFQHAFLFMLLGLKTPEEFASDMRKEGVSNEVIAGLTADINEKVFVPIRNQERENPESLNPDTAVPETPAVPTGPTWVQVAAPQQTLAPQAPLTQTPIYSNSVPPQAPRMSVSAFERPVQAENQFVPQAPPNVVLPGAPIQAVQQPAPFQYAPQAEQQWQQPAPPPQYGPAPTQSRGPTMQDTQVFHRGELVASVRTMATDMEAMKTGHQPAPHIMAAPQLPPENPYAIHTQTAPAQPVQYAQQAPAAQPQPIQYAPVQQPAAQPQQWQQPQIPAAASVDQFTSPQWSTRGPLSEQARPAAQPTQYTRPYIPPTPRVFPKASPVPQSGDAYREPIE